MLQEKSHEALHSVTYLATAENVARQVAETVAESGTFFNGFNQLSASLRSHTGPLPSVNVCALCNVSCVARQVARNIAK